MVDFNRHLHTRSGVATDPVRLLPVPVRPYAPVRQEERQHYLRLLLEQYKSTHLKLHPDDNVDIPPLKNTLITRTVNKEFDLANRFRHKQHYQHELKKLMSNLKKYGTENGERATSQSPAPDDDEFEEEYAELNAMATSTRLLIKNGFIMSIPELPDPDYELPTAVPCDHCGVEFNTKNISQKVICQFHRGKKINKNYDDIKMGRKIYGPDYKNKVYSCCNEVVGLSPGCEFDSHHVYRYKSAIDLHLSKNFQTIQSLRKSANVDDEAKSQRVRKSKIKAIGLDCEMCYTDKGFEMMKLSVVDFKTEKKLIDATVHPDGDLILDLNTNISGISEIPSNSLTFDEALIKLAQLTDEDTVVVGHGLENDLNILRVIYPKIVDTAIIFSDSLFDHKRKNSLKNVAWSELSRNIQGGAHDSLEDAVVPCQVIKKHIKNVLYLKRRNQYYNYPNPVPRACTGSI